MTTGAHHDKGLQMRLPYISEIHTNPSSFRLIIKPEAIYPTVPFTQNPFVIFTKFSYDFPVHASLISCLHTTRPHELSCRYE